MARSGCAGLLIGFETRETRSAERYRQAASTIPTLYRALVADLHALGISIQGCFVFGNDHDDTRRVRRAPRSS